MHRANIWSAGTAVPWLATSVGLLVMLPMAMSACSGADEDVPRGSLQLGSGGYGTGHSGGYGPQSCDEGHSRECIIEYPEHNGVKGCFVGTEVCEDGSWSPCGAAEDHVQGNSFSTSQPCPNNSCDPECKTFKETPTTPWVPTDSGGSGSGGTCASISAQADLKPVNMFIAVDKSGSMGWQNRWVKTKNAFVAFFQQAIGFRVAMEFFPYSGFNGTDGCYNNKQECKNSEKCSNPFVPLCLLTAQSAPADTCEQSLLSAFNTFDPGGGTPLKLAQQGAVRWAEEHTGSAGPDEQHVIVLVTDGSPNDCGSKEKHFVKIAADALSNGIRTYGIGIVGADEDLLQAIATAGGGESFFIDNANNIEQDLSDAMSAIAGDVIGCDFDLPQVNADVWTETTPKLVASNRSKDEYFGNSVALSGDYAIIGAHEDNGNGNDSGAAYIFSHDETTGWIESQKLLASDGGNGDRFGYAVSMSDDRAIVGAIYHDDNGSNSGAAYIFERDISGYWTETQVLLASDGAKNDLFGYTVSISGDYAIIGARNNDDKGSNSGSAYIFQRDMGGHWTQTQKLLASDGAKGDNFGWSVSISGDYAIVGARNNDDDGKNSGSAYVFERDMGGNWTQTQKLLAADAGKGDYFGAAVSVRGGVAIVGAYKEDGGVPTIAGDCGAAYIFERDMGGNWTQTQKLLAADPGKGDYFGHKVSISDEDVIVGAYRNDDNGSNSGSAYMFERDTNGNWTQTQKLLASDGAKNDAFGYSVSVDGDYALVGAHIDDDTRGSAYIFEAPGASYDPSDALVSFIDGSMNSTDFNQVTNAGDCGVSGGWYFDNPSNPTKIILCPQTCGLVSNDPTGKIEIIFPCEGQGEATTFSESYQATCPDGLLPQWMFFAYDTTAPGSSQVQFSVRTATTQGDLGAKTLVPVATATSTPDTQVCAMAPPGNGCPVDLFTAVGQPAAHHPWLELSVTLQPDSNGPQVNNWEITHSCIAGE